MKWTVTIATVTGLGLALLVYQHHVEEQFSEVTQKAFEEVAAAMPRGTISAFETAPGCVSESVTDAAAQTTTVWKRERRCVGELEVK